MAADDPTAPLAVRRWWGWWRPIPRDGGEYMERRSLRRQLATGLNAWRVYVNHFLAPDEPGYHDHPWPFSCSLVLWGSYTEEYLVDPADVRPQDRLRDAMPLVWTDLDSPWVMRRRVRWFNWIPGSRQRYHRIAELHPSRFGGRGVVTLFFCGPLSGLNWGHWVPGRGHVDKAAYDAERRARFEAAKGRVFETHTDLLSRL